MQHDQVGKRFTSELLPNLERDHREVGRLEKNYRGKVAEAKQVLEKLEKTADKAGRDANKFAKVMQETNMRKKQLEVLNMEFYEKMCMVRDQQYRLTLQHLTAFFDAQYEYVGQAYARLHELQPEMEAMKKTVAEPGGSGGHRGSGNRRRSSRGSSSRG